MPHVHTHRLLEAWRRRSPPGEAPPARTALSPLRFGALMPQLSVLAADADGTWRFRTAGELAERLHGRPLAGGDLLDLWAAEHRGAVRDALGEAAARGRPWLLPCRAATRRGRELRLELLLAPTTGPGGATDRGLLLHQPLSSLTRLGGEGLGPLRLGASASAAGRLRLIVDNTRAPSLGSAPRADVAER